MSFNVKSEILSAIAKTEDQNMKSLLLIMLGVLEEISGKIDAMLNDEKALRETVLNGHEPVHHQHHEWLAERITKDEEVRLMMAWIKVKMQAEMDNKATARKLRDDLIAKVLGWATLAFLGFVVGQSGLLK